MIQDGDCTECGKPVSCDTCYPSVDASRLALLEAVEKAAREYREAEHARLALGMLGSVREGDARRALDAALDAAQKGDAHE